MSAINDAKNVNKNIGKIFERRIVAVQALSLFYAAQALKYFQTFQSANRFWVNQTNQAKDRVFTEVFRTFDSIGWLIAHGVDYGVYLELTNNRQNEALRPVILRFLNPYIKAVRKIYSD